MNNRDLSTRVLLEDAKHSHLSSNGFAGASGGSEKNIVVCVVETVEQLWLDRVEVSEGVEQLQLCVSQCRHWQRL